MRRVVSFIAVLLMVLFALATSAQANARPSAIPCGPNMQPGICTPAYQRGDHLLIRPGVPFVWLRATPSSAGHISSTVWPSSGPVLEVVSSPPSWDGFQSWYFVAPIGNSLVNGWVEQVSMVLPSKAITPTPIRPPKANWTVPMVAKLRPGLPFAWLRRYATSYAPYAYTIYPGTLFTVLGKPDAYFDGAQWWWPAQVLTPGSTVTGWLEQVSIVTASATIPTPVIVTPVSCPAVTPPRLIIGWKAHITLGPPNNLRAYPSRTGYLIGTIPGGAEIHVLAGPVCDGQFVWWQVAYRSQLGWTAESDGKTYFIVPG